MSRSAGRGGRRSGDPRKRAVQAPTPHSRTRRRSVVGALVAAGALAALALVALRPTDDDPDDEARGHARAACELTSKADEAAQVGSDARYAAAVLLLDQAILESTRAAETDTDFAGLDRAVQAVHAAGHRGSPEEWRDALGTALDACRAAVS